MYGTIYEMFYSLVMYYLQSVDTSVNTVSDNYSMLNTNPTVSKWSETMD